MSNIKNGIIQVNKIFDIPFRVDLIPTSNKQARPGKIITPKGITYHNTGNPNKAADAKMHTEYVDSPHGFSSWHITIDQFEIIQELPFNEESYHAGDGGNGPGNMTQISIELCENANWQKVRMNGIKFGVWLINELWKDKSAQQIVHPHKKWSNKYCPRIILNEGWEQFVRDIDTFRQTAFAKPVNADELTWKEILKLYTNDFDTWEKALVTAIAAAKENSNMGDLEIFKWFPELITQIYNRQK